MSIEKVGWFNGVKGKSSRGERSHTAELDFRWESVRDNWGRVTAWTCWVSIEQDG